MSLLPFQLMDRGSFCIKKFGLAITAGFMFVSTQISFSQIGAEHLISSGALGGSIDLELSDVDNDGDLDAIFIELNTNTVSWFENTGGGNFGAVQLISSGNMNSPQSLNTGDINGDGYPDVLACSVGNTSSWYASLGNGTFGSQNLVPYSESASISRATIADFDTDGDNDIVMYSRGTDAFFFIENLGGGSLANAVLIADNVPEYVLSIVAADFDNDGLLDFAFAAEQDAVIGWLKNLTGTTFGPIQIVPNMPYDPNSLKTLDLDHDGDMDLVFSSGGLGGIAWIENLGNGTFSNLEIIGNSSIPQSFGVGHLNDDGYVDFFTASSSPIDNGIYWFNNLQNLSWSQPSGFGAPATSLPRAIAVGDIDNDGDDDAAVLLLGSLRWYENYLIPPNILKGKVFHDENANGTLDPNENGMIVGNASITPGGNHSYSNDLGEFSFATSPGTFSIEHQGLLPSPFWTLTTDSVLTVTTGMNDPPIETLHFGYSINSVETILDGYVTGSPSVCDNNNVYWLDVWNQGTTKPSGVIQLDLDDSTSFVSASVTPDSIVGNSIYWHFNNIDYFNHEMITYYLDMPSSLSMGETLVTTVYFNEIDSSGSVNTIHSYEYNEILLCTSDPNNKSVTPIGVGSEGVIPAFQDLEYTVRFQNTGDFMATNVMITDTLDSNLDWNSLRYLGSSHPVDITRDSAGIVKFKFNDINLPDSASNEPESHGFVKFKIDLASGLANGDKIRNQANIFFDLNPPVITNGTLNTIGGVSGTHYDAELFIYPNPSSGKFNLAVKNNPYKTNVIVVTDLSGRIVYQQNQGFDTLIPIDLSEMRNGVYFVSLLTKSKRILSSERYVKTDL